MSKQWFGGAVIGGMILFAVLVASMLPEQMPTHWNHRGEVDAWSTRWRALAMPIGVALGVWLLAVVAPRIDPRGENYKRFQKTYWIVINVILLTLVAVLLFMVGTALGWPIRVEVMTPVLVGATLVVLGNLLPRVRSNWVLGIRTPWTLDSDAVWRRTHRLGGWCMVTAGALILLSAVLPADTRLVVMVGASLVGALVPAIASYFFWRRERKDFDARANVHA